MSRRPRLSLTSHPVRWLAAALMCVGLNLFSAETVILHLKNGDRITGVVIAETAGEVVVSNRWTKTLTVPLAEIGRRETPAPEVVIAPPPRTNLVATPLVPPKTDPGPVPSRWKGEAQIGLNLIYSKKEQQIYYGKFKLAYAHPYPSNPKMFFKNTLEYNAEYGKTDGEKSSDRMTASDKTDFDLYEKWYAYNLAGVGYDYVKKINLQYEEGFGVGYHLITQTNLTFNTESGVGYQVQDRSSSADSRDFFFRVAEDLTWKPSARTTLTEKFEFFPRWDMTEFRLRFESTLAYEVWKNISLNVTVRDLYDTRPADDASANDLQIRSSLGVKF